MNRAGTLRKVKEVLRRYNNATAALQEIRWERKGMNEVNDIRVEIRSRVSDGNKCYYALGSVMKSKSI
jgi:hypothetical protein